MTEPRNKFTCYVLSHGRPNNVPTIDTAMSKHGYTGEWYLVIDDEDETLPGYIKRYGRERVIVFPKRETMASIDMGDNFGIGGSVVPRAAIWDIAKQRGDKYFIMLDDDYRDFRWKFDAHGMPIPYTPIKSLDEALQALVDYFDACPERVLTLAITQNGDFIGGYNGGMLDKIFAKRKAMNLFVCSTERPFTFPARMNEDVNAYTEIQRRGYAFMTINRFSLQQTPTQQMAGGMTAIYRQHGTYVKTFYSIMRCPSGVKVSVLGDRNVDPRVHHRVTYNHVAPKIIPERYRKA